MKKPRYMEGILKIVFFWLGAAFFLMGLLCFFGIMTPKESSMVQDQTVMGIMFAVLGVVFFTVQAVLELCIHLKNKRHHELLEHGTKVGGTVEGVYLQKYTQYGKQSPYRILYTYTFQGRVYHHKSCLLWEVPDCGKGDPIAVYADGSGKSTLPYE